ncbi:hypothetical protein [Streptomyces sp. t39]|uniref:hypothetical protein n=1 Tax=Streptomyces sp. t39 TaxID=1828156 RepID=UPI00165014A1|nr:hypothetical protein [Streptomyces sp. t39]
MHMNSAPHLLTEDRAEYERVLDEALRDDRARREPAAGTARLSTEQLRTMALNATALIVASAAAEYEHYVKVRAEVRAAAGGTGHGTAGLGPAVGAAESGAGVAAVVAVLAPLLAGTAAAIFLIAGYLLKMLSPPPAFADTLLSAGWVFGALTAAAVLAAAVALLLTALRNDASHVADGRAHDEPPPEVRDAKEAWCEALLDRGILPFLRAALAERPQTPAPTDAGPPVRRIPRIGYSGPEFSSPAEGRTAGRRPRYTSPDFSSPDFGGPEHQPD